MNRRKFLLTLLIAIIGTFAFSAAPRYGERPFIDIYQVPDSAMEQGHIRIKLSEDHSALAQSFQYQDGALASFGLEELDALNLEYGISRITPVFGDVSKNLKWGWRHIEWGLHLWFELEYDSAADIRDIVMAYRDLKENVQWAEPEYKKTLLSVNQDEVSAIAETLTRWTPNDQRYGEQWHYNNTGQTGGTVDADIDLPEAWDIEKGHPDVIVDVQDGGFQLDHPDLDLNKWVNPGEIPGNGIDDDSNGYIDDVNGYNFVDGSANIVGHFHGTHVAGTIAAENNNSTGVSGIAGGNGTTRGVSLMSTQVFTSSSSGGFETAPIYGADNGAAISQNSWGYTQVGAYDQVVLDAIDYFNANGGGAVMDGGITIYAAGNDNSSGQWYPGCYSGTFAVAATNHNDERSYYSNYDYWVDVSAPGGETTTSNSRGVLSTYTGSSYNFLQGTSMACPHTSGVAALVLSYAHRNGRTLSNTDLADFIRSTTDDHYGVNSSYINQLGSGRINAYSALMATDPTLPSVSISAPAGGSVHDLNSNITITATATDTDGYITGVAFYIDDVLKSTDTSSPYSWVWNTSGYAGGAHSIKVIATDDDGNTATRSITVTLLAPPDEGFETGNFTLYPWVNNSSVPWTVQTSEVFSGTYAAQSGDIGDSNTTTISLPVVISSAGNISFWYKVSSESSWDFLRFYIDGNLQDEWSGTAGWSEASYPVSSGSHTFSWTYYKDGSVSSGSDCAWLDHIIFPPMGTYYAPPRNLTAASGNGYVNLAWDTPASGSPSSYKVYRDGSYLTNTGGLSYSDNAVVNETSYEYYVTAIYGSEESDPSNTVAGNPTANQEQFVIIGTGTATQSYPIDRYYNYSAHEAIYLASEIGSAGTIQSLGYYKSSGADVNSITGVTVYMKHTTASTISTGTYSTAGYTQVYSGAWPNTVISGWMEVDLTTTFSYDGTSNLSILVVKDYQAYLYYNYPTWTYSNSTSYRARQDHDDYTAPTTLNRTRNLPNIKLTYIPPVIQTPEILVSPLALDFGTVEAGETSVLQFTVQNTGTATLTGSISTPTGYSVDLTQAKRTGSSSAERSASPAGKSAPALFSAPATQRNTLSFDIPAGADQAYDLTFAPTAAQAYPGYVVVSSNDADEPTVNILLSGTGQISNTEPSIALPESFSFEEDGSLTVDFSPYVEDAQTPDSGLTLGYNGNTDVTVSIDGLSVTFGATGNWNGTEIITFTVGDGELSASDAADVIVTPVNDPPAIVLPDSFTFAEDGSLTVDFSGYVTDLETPEAGLTLGYSGNTDVTVSIVGLSVTFGATGNWNGTEIITFTVGDGELSASDAADVIVTPVNDPPTIALPENLDFDMNSSLVHDFSPYVSDIEANTLSLDYSGNTNLLIAIDGLQVTFTATPDWYGSEEITFSVFDGYDYAYDTVTVTVNFVNHAPTLILPLEGFEFDMNESLMVDFGPYIEDLDGHSVTLSVGESDFIQAAIDGHTVTFSSPTDWFGSETLNFVVDDGYASGYCSVEVRVNLNYLAVPEVMVAPNAGGVTVSWSPVANANRYHIYRAADPYGNYEPLTTVLAPATSWEDPEALPMAFYKVVAAFEELPAKQ